MNISEISENIKKTTKYQAIFEKDHGNLTQAMS